jgi:hypothetical protein
MAVSRLASTRIFQQLEKLLHDDINTLAALFASFMLHLLAGRPGINVFSPSEVL